MAEDRESRRATRGVRLTRTAFGGPGTGVTGGFVWHPDRTVVRSGGSLEVIGVVSKGGDARRGRALESEISYIGPPKYHVPVDPFRIFLSSIVVRAFIFLRFHCVSFIFVFCSVFSLSYHIFSFATTITYFMEVSCLFFHQFQVIIRFRAGVHSNCRVVLLRFGW